MESKAKLIGHPIHPILIPFLLGLLTTSVVFDIVYLITGGGRWAKISFWMIAAGVIGGLVAAVFGLIDWLAIPSGTRAKAVGLLHGLTNFLMVALFAIGWLLRAGEPGRLPSCSRSQVLALLLLEVFSGRACRTHGCRGIRRGEPQRAEFALRTSGWRRLDRRAEGGIESR